MSQEIAPNTMTSRFRLSLLGSFQLECHRNGQVHPLELPRRKDASLLAYLALYPKSHRREHLATLFWGDTPDFKARSSLRTALSDLRKALGKEAVLTGRETITLDPALSLWVDVYELNKILDTLKKENSAAQLSQSDFSLLSQELLPDFTDDWLIPVRTTLWNRRIETLFQVAVRERAQQHYAQAIQWAQRALQLDAANEAAHQLVMACQVALGDTAAAFRQYELCRRVLRKELDAEPSHETKLWYETLRRTGTTKTLAPQRTNLPDPLTSFIGREQEIQALNLLCQRTRLTSLTGAGGAGKTRLALELGHAQMAHFADGVWWVELSPLSDVALIPHQVAKALGIQENPQEPLTETLLYFLRARQALLILDNCEHLLEGCAEFVATLLSTCPGLTVLTTSREALNLSGEQVYHVTPLGIPRAPIESLAEVALAFPAVRLFVERAQLANSRFCLDDANALAVVRICQRVDGIPLAIELAASRIREMNAADLAARLALSFDLLVGTRRSQPRQQTLRALIDWSYNLLTEREQALFRQLSVFAGGWTLETLAGVVGPGDDSTHPDETLSLMRVLEALVDKSLATADITLDETRYTLLKTVREYAHAKLEQAGEASRLQRQHAAYFARLAEQYNTMLKGAAIRNGMLRLKTEHDNLHVALQWALVHDPSNLGLRLTGALANFWAFSRQLAEGREWSEQMLTVAQKQNTLAYARGLSACGTMAWANDEFEPALTRHTQALALFRAHSAFAEMAETLGNLGMQFYLLGDYARALECEQEAVQTARLTGDSWTLSNALLLFGITRMQGGEPAQARVAFTEGLEIARACEHFQLVCYLLSNLGAAATEDGHYAQANVAYQEAVAIADEIQDEFAMAGTRREWAFSLLKRGEPERARSLFAETLKLAVNGGRHSMAIHALDGLGMCAAGLEPTPSVARLLGATEALRAKMNYVREPLGQSLYDRMLERLVTALGDAVVAEELAAGQILTLEQALAWINTNA